MEQNHNISEIDDLKKLVFFVIEESPSVLTSLHRLVLHNFTLHRPEVRLEIVKEVLNHVFHKLPRDPPLSIKSLSSFLQSAISQDPSLASLPLQQIKHDTNPNDFKSTVNFLHYLMSMAENKISFLNAIKSDPENVENLFLLLIEKSNSLGSGKCLCESLEAVLGIMKNILSVSFQKLFEKLYFDYERLSKFVALISEYPSLHSHLLQIFEYSFLIF